MIIKFRVYHNNILGNAYLFHHIGHTPSAIPHLLVPNLLFAVVFKFLLLHMLSGKLW